MALSGNALLGIVNSRKNIIALPLVIGSFVAFFMGRITWDQMESFVTKITGLLITGIIAEDVTTKVMNGKVQVEAIKLPPPASPTVTVTNNTTPSPSNPPPAG